MGRRESTARAPGREAVKKSGLPQALAKHSLIRKDFCYARLAVPAFFHSFRSPNPSRAWFVFLLILASIECFVFQGVSSGAVPEIPRAETSFQQGVDFYAAEQYKKSIRALEQAVERAPRRAEYRLWLGRAYGRRADGISKLFWWRAIEWAGKARDAFEKAAELDAANTAILADLMDYYLQAPGFLGGGIDKAEKIAERIAAADSALGERAWATIDEQREDHDSAETRLRKAVELDPEELDHRLSLASFLARQGRYSESDRIYRDAAALAPESHALWFSRAKALVRAGRAPDEARLLLKRYLAAELPADAEPRSEARKLLKRL